MASKNVGVASKNGRSRPASTTAKHKARTFRSIDDVRRTYYPNAFRQMLRKRQRTGMERLPDHAPDPT